MTHREVTIECDAAEVERIERALDQAGAVAITLADAGDSPLFEPAPGAAPLWRRVAVSALLPDQPDLPRRLARWLSAAEIAGLRERVVGGQDWTATWRQHVQVCRYGDRLAVIPFHVEAPEGVAAVVRLDPGLAFGTGSHPTTRLCLAWLAERELAGRVVLDYGSGSGILSLAAARLGARCVLAVDHDPQALQATRDNAARNGLEPDRVRAMAAPAADLPPADVIVANILARPLIELAGRLGALAARGAHVALAGLLEAQADEVIAAYAPWVALGIGAREDGWVRLQGQCAS